MKRGKNVIIATGAYSRPIRCKGEAEYIGKGVSYCATCDANFFEGFEVYVVGGGGQPIHDGEELAFERGRTLYHLDKNMDIRFSHENPNVKEAYNAYFGKPMSHTAHMLLHTEHKI